MITNTFRGQLGNQMFQVATTIAHAKRVGSEYAFPLFSGKRMQFDFAFKHRLPIIDHESHTYRSIPVERELVFGGYQQLPKESDLNLQGYWQHYKYFDHIRDELIDHFGFKYFPTYMGDYVSIHLRRGDSLRFIGKLPQPTDNYFHDAISYFPTETKFAVFTDDVDFALKYFTYSRFNRLFHFVEPSDAFGDMCMMASCKSHIIVNSTFSWMAAYFGNNPFKKVICPTYRSWFAPAYWDRLSADGLMYPDWIQIRY